MKKRDGWVSNSSSSSFCLVGVSGHRAASAILRSLFENGESMEDRDIVNEMLDMQYSEWETKHGKKAPFDNFDHGMFRHLGTGLVFNVSGSCATTVGVSPDILEEHTLQEARKIVAALLNEHFKGKAIEGKDVDLHYGECSDE